MTKLATQRTAVEAFGKMIADGMAIQARIRREREWAQYREDRDARVKEKFAAYDLAALRALWDSEEGLSDCDDIHAELNRRGDGDYCAV